MVDDTDLGDVDSFPQPTMRILTEQARERLSEFYKPALNRHKARFQQIRPFPMPAPIDTILYQSLQINTEEILAEYAKKELNRGVENEISLEPGVPCCLGYERDPE